MRKRLWRPTNKSKDGGEGKERVEREERPCGATLGPGRPGAALFLRDEHRPLPPPSGPEGLPAPGEGPEAGSGLRPSQEPPSPRQGPELPQLCPLLL